MKRRGGRDLEAWRGRQLSGEAETLAPVAGFVVTPLKTLNYYIDQSARTARKILKLDRKSVV